MQNIFYFLNLFGFLFDANYVSSNQTITVWIDTNVTLNLCSMFNVSNYEIEVESEHCNINPAEKCDLMISCRRLSQSKIYIRLNHTQSFLLTINALYNRVVIQKVFSIGLSVILFVALFTMGCTLNIKEMNVHLMNPVNIIIGLFCQFALMPLISLGLSRALKHDKDLAFYGIGIFVCGIVPGGGASNLYTFLFGGNVDLSVVMTFSSTVRLR